MMILGKIVLGMAGTALAGAGLLCSEGLVQVNVRETQPEAHHIYVVAPAMLMPIAMRFVPRNDLTDASQQIQPYMPVIRAAMDGLRDTDDVTLVEVKDSNENVRVDKRGGNVVVDVKDENDTVHVSVPIRAISSTLEQLSAATQPAQN
ncbi:MAG: hypothetical protein ACRD4S_15990 [Candidatus Acidiferrales bacterium]